MCFIGFTAMPQNPIPIEINPKENIQKLKLSDIAESVEYIPLETVNQSLIDNMFNCKLTKDYIFIMQLGIILQFQKDGKFVRQINKLGQGPSECFCRCAAFDEDNQLIYIYNNYTNRILVYGFDGKFKHNFKDPLDEMASWYTSNIDCWNGRIFLTFDNTHGNMPYKYVVIDSYGKILHKEPNYDLYTLNANVLESARSNTPFHLYENTLYYKYPRNDTVYRINQNYECSAIYEIKIPDRITLEETMKTGAYVLSYSEIKHKNLIESVNHNSRYVFVRYMLRVFDNDNRKQLLSLYDKQTGKLMNNIDPFLVNDIDGGMSVKLNNHGNMVVYNLVWPFEIKEKLTSKWFEKSTAIYPEKQKALKTLIKKLLEDDNPVLIIVKFK
jgi:hypothetical protein